MICRDSKLKTLQFYLLFDICLIILIRCINWMDFNLILSLTFDNSNYFTKNKIKTFSKLKRNRNDYYIFIDNNLNKFESYF